MEQQQPAYVPEENPRVYTMLSNVSPTTNNEIPYEQQIVYYNPPVNYQTFNNAQSYPYPQQLLNGQIVNQFSSNNLAAKQHQQQPQQHTGSSINMTNAQIQQSMMHSNMNQQQIALSYQPPVNLMAPPPHSSMINPTGSSTPISATTKRGRNDTSGVSESNVQLRPQYSQPTRIFNSNNTPNKRLRGANQQRNQVPTTNQFGQNIPIHFQQNVAETRVPGGTTGNEHVVSNAACRFAASRYPFAPFSVIFTQEVREKIVVDDLIKHASDKWNFELKTIAYRKGRSENNEHRILIFVENSESFVFLHNHSNWPETLADYQFTIKSPSIPPQLALVIPSVSLEIDWDEFVQELKEMYPDIANIIRLKNKAQQP
ncbi:unnamed protein product, partial [Rotaria sp. Silwood1]